MNDAETERAYRRFCAIWANSEPVRASYEFAAALRAAGATASGVDDDWLRGLNRAWVYGESGEPFDDDQRNLSYRRELRER